MPFKSDKQRKFFHTQTALDKGIKPSTVKEFDKASKGMELPKTTVPNLPALPKMDKFQKVRKYFKK